MPLRVDNVCLHPRLSGSADGPPRRVRGLLRRAGEPGLPHLIDAIDFDGERCRYRTVGDGPGRWLDGRPDDDYRACPPIVIGRLLALERAGREALPSAEAVLTDAVVTPEGSVRLAVRDVGDRASRWIEA